MRILEQPFLKSVPASSLWCSDIARVAVMTGVVKLAGGIKTAFSARILGLSDAFDAYLIAFSITSFVCDSLAGSLSPALIPLFVGRAQSDGMHQLHASYGGALYRSVLLLSLAGAGLLLFRGAIVHILAPGFSREEVSLTHSLMLVLAPMFPIMGINAVWRSLLNSQNRFLIPATAPVMTPLIATGLLVFAHSVMGIYTLAIGSTLGVFAEMLILGTCVSKLGMPVLPRVERSPINLRWLKRNCAPLLFSNLMHGGVNIVDQSVATLAAAGSVSTLVLGTRLVSVVMAIGPATLSTVFLPKLSRLVSIQDLEGMQQTIKQWLLRGCTGACLLSSVFVLFSDPLAHFVLRNGSSNSAIHTVQTVQSLSFLQLPFVVGAVILVRTIVSLQLNRKLVSIALLALIVNAVLDVSLVRLIGISGIVISTAAVQALTFFVLFRIVRNIFASGNVICAAA